MTVQFPAIWRPDMFGDARVKRMVPQGLTYAEIALDFGVPAEFWAEIDDGLTVGRIQVNGVMVPRAKWEVACPVHADLVTLSMVPGKGFKAGNIAAILGAVAVTGLTLGIGAGFAAPLLGAGFASGTFGASALAAGVGLVGSAALRMLFPPPGAGSTKTRREKPIAGIGQNVLQPLAQITGIRGLVTYSPPPVHAFTELQRGVIFANGLYPVAGRNAVTDLRVNRSLAADLPSVQTEVLEGDPGDGNITLVNKTGLESMSGPEQMSEFDLKEGALDTLQDQATPTNSYPIWHGFTTRGSGWDQIWSRFHWPQGIAQRASSGDVDPGGVPIRGRMRLLGEVSWRNLPEFHFQDESKLFKRLIKEIRFIYDVVPGGFEAFGTGTTAGADKDFVGYTAYAIAGEGEAFEWLADSYFDQGGSAIFADNVDRIFDGFRVYLDPADWPPGVYEVQWMRGLTYDSGTNFDADAYTYNGSASNANFFEHYDDGGTDKVRINQETFTGQVYIEQFTTYYNRRPVADVSDWPCPMTWIAVRAKYINLDIVSADFHSKVTKWTGAAWSGVDVSSNPAELYRDTLIGLLNAKPLASALRNDTNLGAFADFCDDRGYECNMPYAGSVKEALETIAACGFGVPWQKEQWGVTWEYDRSAEDVVDMYSPLNARLGNAERPFPDRPLAILAEYEDEDDQYKTKQEKVYADGHDASTVGTQIEARPYPGFTNRLLAIERATFDLRQLQYRMSRYPIEIGRQQILASKGELVGLSHDIIVGGEGRGFGLVAEVIFAAGGNVAALRLEGPAPLSNVGGAVSVEMLLLDRTTRIEPIIEQADSAILTFSSTFAMPVNADGVATLQPGCVVAFGAAGNEKRRCLIESMSMTAQFGATIALVPEAPELHYPARAIDLAAVINEHEQIELSWVQPRQSRTSHANIYRSLSGTIGSATLIDTVTGVPGASKIYTDEPASDDWFYWVEPHDNDGHMEEKVARVSITGGYDADAAAAFAAFTAELPGARYKAINDLIEGLKSDGVWSLMILLYLAMEEQQPNDINIVSPGNNTLGRNGSPTWAANQGYTGDGSTMFLTTGYIVPGARQDDFGIFLWSETAAAAASTGSFDMGSGASGTGRLDIRCRGSDDFFRYTMHDSTVAGVANTDGSGFYIVMRSASNARRARKDTAEIHSSATVSNGVPAGQIHILGIAGSTNRSARRISIAGACRALTNGQSDALQSRLATYRATL